MTSNPNNGRTVLYLQKLLIFLGICILSDASSFFKFGGGADITSEPLHAHDFIPLHAKTKQRIYAICAPLYEKGLSLREIEAQTGIAKSTIRGTLNHLGFSLRNFENGRKISGDKTKFKNPGHAPYGFAWLDGKQVVDPRELVIVRKILKLWREGLAANAIAKQLNRQKIPTRWSGIWRSSVVCSIIKRHEEINLSMNKNEIEMKLDSKNKTKESIYGT